MENINENINTLKVPGGDVEFLDSNMEVVDSLPKEEVGNIRQARKRIRSDSSPSLEDRTWSELFDSTDADFTTVAKVRERFSEMVYVEAAKRISKQLAGDLVTQFDLLATVAKRLIAENLALKSYNKGFMHAHNRLAEKVEGLAGSRNQISYAAAVQGNRVPPVTGRSTKIRSVAQVAVVSPPEGTKVESDTTDKLKTQVMRTIDPVKEKIKIKAVRRRDNGRICIETASAEDMDKILSNKDLKQQGIKVTKLGLLRPRLLVFDVPTSLSAVNIIDNVYAQNESAFEGIRLDEFKSGFEPKFRTGKKNMELTNWVVEVSPRIRNALRSRGSERIYIGWQACKIQDYRGISRCFKCLRFGHVSKFCKDEVMTCSYCSEKGHEYKACDKRSNKIKPVCSNCKVADRPHDHEAVDKNCPAYKLALERLISRTDYGVQE